MSTSFSVKGIKPPGEKWKKMKAVYDACKKVNITIPEEVFDFFEDKTPDDDGVVIQLADEYSKECHESVTKINKEGTGGFSVDLTKLPKDITIIRFEIGW